MNGNGRPDRGLTWLRHRQDLATQRVEKAEEDLRILRQLIARVRAERRPSRARA